MNIAFCINRLGLLGLGTTLTSLIRNCSKPDCLILYFLCAGLLQKDKNQILKLLLSEQFEGKCQFIDFDPKANFGKFKSLHGDWTAYGRLLLPDLIYEDQVLYLDSDLVVELDVLELIGFEFNGHALAAVIGGPLSNTLENNFYIGLLGLSPHLNSFNSGVLLFNLKEWRLNNIKDNCIQIGCNYPMELLSCDQTILNAYFAGNFSKLPDGFNCVWYAHKAKPSLSDKMIYHFVGSPKPWDLMGSIIHNGYPTWKKYSRKDWDSAFGSFTLTSIRRMWKIRRSYTKAVINKIRG
ncbi:glycosyltransferase family 8 protein [Cyclobacterium salsum]|uniref:glycosyltransferase family 8 protein n=1 Tax=Cyclobacterium salsum TaxID=2666329 RepID=UPI001390A15F|nr:glycosyltransferase [Cyclobacterium salsum]